MIKLKKHQMIKAVQMLRIKKLVKMIKIRKQMVKREMVK